LTLLPNSYIINNTIEAKFYFIKQVPMRRLARDGDYDKRNHLDKRKKAFDADGNGDDSAVSFS
jgi:hypothetical protein